MLAANRISKKKVPVLSSKNSLLLLNDKNNNLFLPISEREKKDVAPSSLISHSSSALSIESLVDSNDTILKQMGTPLPQNIRHTLTPSEGREVLSVSSPPMNQSDSFRLFSSTPSVSIASVTSSSSSSKTTFEDESNFSCFSTSDDIFDSTFTSEFKSNPKLQLIDAIKSGDLEDIKKLLKITSVSLLNEPDTESGRTVGHLAAAYSKKKTKAKEILTLLVEYGLDLSIRDKEDFTAYELLVNPHAFRGKADDADYDQVKYLVGEMNAEYHLKNITNKQFVFVNSMLEITRYIEKHPEYDQIGFAVKMPNAIKSPSDIHISPIFYDKKTQMFVQTDSLGFIYLIPHVESATFYYSPFERQANSKGCAEDAVRLLKACMTSEWNYLKFVHENSEKEKLENMKPELFRQYAKLMKRMKETGEESKALSKKEKQDLSRLHNQNLISIQREAFSIGKISAMESAYKLKTWPMEWLQFVERYDFIREIRIRTSLSTSDRQILFALLDQGNKRDKEIDTTVIQTNLQNPDKKYDFAGLSFFDLYQRIQEKRATQSSAASGIGVKKP